ncbi:SRPBCC domain-containing protein [Fulvivirga lutea]|uniref:SRPBCC domain-containing protein n=1 Tax=Fulvivirga lutea TaxID=2810512 RepID=A0A974WPH6_9BACT|nr:SRPBCC domain-containing protein [Fulvivirga lutea]QSE99258.1 SRPBCC domain-containing protein [Fulvivirga lutea]
MKKLTYQTSIKAQADKVYRVMLGLDNKKTYEQWTAEFNPTSTYEGSWDKGSKIHFVGTDENGNKGGMVSEIVENAPGKFVSIRHYGILQGDKEITEGPQVEQWAGGHENYKFEESNGITTLTVEVDTADEYASYFDETWPKAFTKLKELAEN